MKNIVLASSNPQDLSNTQVWAQGEACSQMSYVASCMPGFGFQNETTQSPEINCFWDLIHELQGDGVSRYAIIGMLESIKAELIAKKS